MRTTSNHLLRALGVLGSVLVLGAGIAVASEHTGLVGGETEPIVEITLDCDGADAEHPDCVTDEPVLDCDGVDADHPDCVTEEAPDETPGDETPDEEAPDEEASGDEGPDESGDEGSDEGDGPPEGTHGAVVSEAAKDRSHIERCGTHGAWVSSVARGLDDCIVPPGRDRGEEGDDSEDTIEPAAADPGPPAHAGPPPHAGQGGGPPAHAGQGGGPRR